MVKDIPNSLCSRARSLSLRSSSTHNQLDCTSLSSLRAADGARKGAHADRVSNHGSHCNENYPDANLSCLLLGFAAT